MGQAGSLPPSIRDALARELADHMPALCELAARLASLGSEQDASASDRSVRSENLLPRQPEAEQFVDSLAAIATAAVAANSDYWDCSESVAHFRRALLPSLLRLYSPGPELQLLFSALDALDATWRVLIGWSSSRPHGGIRSGEAARMQVLGDLTLGVTHSLNNSLAAILGSVQLVETGSDNPAVRAQLQAVAEAARRAAHSLRLLQDYAAGPPDEELVPRDLNLAAGQAVELTHFSWRNTAEARGTLVDVVLDPAEVPLVLAKPGLLRQALVELIIDAVESLGGSGLVTLRTERTGVHVRCALRTLAREPASSLKPLSGNNGVLARILQEGWIRVEESREQTAGGATLTLVLNVAAQQSPAEPVASRGEAAGATVLLVDDESSLRETGAKLLQAHGVQVITADSGRAALELQRDRGPVDFLLTDLGMPEMNGVELARLVKRSDPRTVVVLMTGWGSLPPAAELAAAGVDVIIHKPFDIQELLRVIADAMSRQV